MNGDGEKSFEERLHEALLSAYDLAEMTRMVRYRLQERLEEIVTIPAPLDNVVFGLIQWAELKDRVPNLTRSAHRFVEDKGATNAKLAALVRELEAIAAAPPPVPPPVVAAAIPESLSKLIESYDGIPKLIAAGPRQTRMMEETAEKILQIPLEPYDLPRRLHLSESPGERLTAVLALNRVPSAEYLRWLSERVTLESEFAGFAAAIALSHAALFLQPDRLPNVRTVAQDAAARLNGQNDGARRHKQLEEVLSFVACRSRSMERVAGLSFDTVWIAMTDAFTLDGLREFIAKEFEMKLERLVALEPPLKKIVFRLLRLADLNKWDHELIVKARAAQPGNQNLDAVFGQYLAAGAII